MLPDAVPSHAPQLITTATTPDTGWIAHVLRVADGALFGALHVEAPHRFRYIAVTVEYLYRGTGQTALYPDTVAVVHIGSSPLQGLSQSPLLYFNEDTVPDFR